MQRITCYKVNEETVVFTGIIGMRAGDSALQLNQYTGRMFLVPYQSFEYVEIENLTDEEILNGPDKAFAAWFQERKAAWELEQAAAEAQLAAEAGAVQ